MKCGRYRVIRSFRLLFRFRQVFRSQARLVAYSLAPELKRKKKELHKFMVHDEFNASISSSFQLRAFAWRIKNLAMKERWVMRRVGLVTRWKIYGRTKALKIA